MVFAPTKTAIVVATVVASAVLALGCAAIESWDGFADTEADDASPITDGGPPITDAPISPNDAPSGNGDGGDGGPLAIVAVQTAFNATEKLQSSIQITFDKTQLAGDLIVVAIGWYSDQVALTSVVDSNNNSYRVAVNSTVLGGSNPVVQTIFFASGVKAAQPNANVITVTWASNVDSPDVRAVEYAGLDPANPLDVSAANKGTGSDAVSNSVTTNFARELLFGAATTQGDFKDAGVGFFPRIITDETNLAEDRFVEAIGSYTAEAPVTPAGQWVMQLATFH